MVRGLEPDALYSFQSVLAGLEDIEPLEMGWGVNDGVPWIFRSEAGLFVVLAAVWLVLIYVVVRLLRKVVKVAVRNL